MSNKNSSELSEYQYVGTDKSGKKCKGTTMSATLALAKAELRRQGIVPTRVRKKPKPLYEHKKKIKSQDITIFFRQMSTMMRSGIPLIQSFDIVSKGHNNPSMQTLLLKVKDDVAAGNALNEVFKKHPKYFDELTCNLVAAGEASGTLEAMLNRIATYKEKTESLKAKVKKALIYPIAVICVAIGVTSILLLYVVPQFKQLFNNYGADLPVITEIVLSLSDMLKEYWYMCLGSIIAFVVAFIQTHKRSQRFRDLIDKLILKLPIFGEIIEKSIYARFSRTLATTFAAGVPLLESLDSVAGAMGNSVYVKAVKKISEDIATGQQLQLAMRNTELFPNMVLQMVAVGEESGALEDMLTKIADFYEEEVDNIVEGLSSLLEPIIIVVLGTIVGGLIVAMYMPIFKMGSVMG